MGTFKRLYKILPLLFLIAVKPALAAGDLPPLDFFGRYDFDWEGIYIGSLSLGIEETTDTYHVHVKVSSGGMVNLFTRHTDNTEAMGKRADGHYYPVHYESFYTTKKKPRHIELKYNKDGEITQDTVEPPEDRRDRPEVPTYQRKGAYDPLSLLMVIRSGATQCHAFDARTLFDVQSAPSAPKTLTLQGTDRPALAYSLTRKPLAGLTAKEKKEYDEGEPPMLLYLSDDTKHIPLMAKVSLFIGRIRGVLVKECDTWDACSI